MAAKAPFRADHVGSLLRPDRLKSARADFEGGKTDADTLRSIEDECIRSGCAPFATEDTKITELIQLPYQHPVYPVHPCSI